MPAMIGARRFIGVGAPSWAPGASVALDFANSRYFGGTLGNALSISRASTGYAQTAAGVLVPFAANTLRITDQGLLVEEARTNIVSQSQAMGSSPWTTLNSAIRTNNYAAAPDGTITATRIQNSGGIDSGMFQGGLTSTAGTHSLTAYVKDNGGPSKVLKLGVGQGFFGAVGGDRQANVDASTGILSSVNAVFTTANSVAVGNGWYRVSLGFTATSAAPANGAVLFYTNGAGCDVLVWGYQLELGSFPTSYIPTTTASTTRAADIPQFIGPALTAALNAKAAFFQTSGTVGSTVTNRLIAFNSGAQASLEPATTASINNGSVALNATLGSGTIAVAVKSAYGMDASSYTARANGGTLVTSANSWGAQSGATYLGNNSAGTRALNGYMQRFALSLTKGAFDGMTA